MSKGTHCALNRNKNQEQMKHKVKGIFKGLEHQRTTVKTNILDGETHS